MRGAVPHLAHGKVLGRVLPGLQAQLGNGREAAHAPAERDEDAVLLHARHGPVRARGPAPPPACGMESGLALQGDEHDQCPNMVNIASSSTAATIR